MCPSCLFYLRYYFQLFWTKIEYVLYIGSKRPFRRWTHIGKSRKLFPKNGRWLRGYPGNFFQTFSRFCNFGAWLRGFSGNYFQVNFMSTYPWKNIFSQKRVMTQRLFRKLFPISGKSFRKFSWVITRIYEISNFI